MFKKIENIDDVCENFVTYFEDHICAFGKNFEALEELIEDSHLYSQGNDLFVLAATEDNLEYNSHTIWHYNLIDWLLACDTTSAEVDTEELEALEKIGVEIRY